MINLMFPKSQPRIFKTHSTNKITSLKNNVLIKIAVYCCINVKKKSCYFEYVYKTEYV